MLLRRHIRNKVTKLDNVTPKSKPKAKSKDLSELTVVELRDMARELDYTGYSTLNKSELLDLLKV